MIKDVFWSPEVQAAVVLILTGFLGVCGYFIIGAARAYADHKLGQIRAALADKAVAYAINETPGIIPGEPVPAERMPEVVEKARDFVQSVNPKQAAAMDATMPERVSARVPVAEPLRMPPYDSLA
jgi:hypothetical protein